jgi:hypothetical protein
VRWVFLVIAVLSVGACAGRDPDIYTPRVQSSGHWRIERQIDRVTGEPVPNAAVLTDKSSNSAVTFRRPAQLSISCFKGEPIVRFAFDFRIGSTRNSVLGYRFDDKPGHEIEARFLQDYKTVVIEEEADVALFMNELATSKTLYVRIRSLNAGRTAVDFPVDGAPAAIEAISERCPIAQPRQGAQVKRRPDSKATPSAAKQR